MYSHWLQISCAGRGRAAACRKPKALSPTAANPSARVFEQVEQLRKQTAKGVGRVAEGDGGSGQDCTLCLFAFDFIFLERTTYKGVAAVLCTLVLCAWTRPAATAGPR